LSRFINYSIRAKQERAQMETKMVLAELTSSELLERVAETETDCCVETLTEPETDCETDCEAETVPVGVLMTVDAEAEAETEAEADAEAEAEAVTETVDEAPPVKDVTPEME